jgi:hypothetical protein
MLSERRVEDASFAATETVEMVSGRLANKFGWRLSAEPELSATLALIARLDRIANAELLTWGPMQLRIAELWSLRSSPASTCTRQSPDIVAFCIATQTLPISTTSAAESHIIR